MGPTRAFTAAVMLAAAAAQAQTQFDFAEPVILDIGFNASPLSVEAGDLDGDSFIDLVLAGRNGEGRVVLFYGEPGGGFEAATDLVLEGQTQWAAFGHLDGDEHIDLAISLRHGLGQVAVILGNGTRTLSEPILYHAGRSPGLVRIADVDDDDDLDLIVFCGGTNDARVLRNDGHGVFGPPESAPVDPTVQGSLTPNWARLADLDGDDDLDMAVVSLGARNLLHLFINTGDGTFGPAIQINVPGLDLDEAISTLAVGDFDEDQDIDVLTKAGSIGSGDRFIILENDGAASFPTVTVIPVDVQVGGAAWDVAVADLDGDGPVDVAWASHLFSSQAAAVLRNEGTGLPSFATPEQAFPLGGFPRAILAQDLDHDGDVDLAVANQTNNSVAILENLRVQERRVQKRHIPGVPGATSSAAGRAPAGLTVRQLADWPGAGRAAAGPVCGAPESGDCFEPHKAPGCDDEACCTLVCESLPLCCLNTWDQSCADVANDTCEPPPVCPGEEGCFEPHESSGCDDQACCELICLIDGFCCDAPWDQRCADEAAELCGTAACSLPECPPEATPEPEGNQCGDRVNDGCIMAEPGFTTVACGELVCATTWTIGNSRDTDWYEVTVDEPAELTWTVDAEFPAAVLIIKGSCDDVFTAAATAYGGGCLPASARLVVEPGTYYLFVSPASRTAHIRDGIGCLSANGELNGGGAFGGRYTARVSCTVCPADLDGDGAVTVVDFFDLLAAWGTDPGGPPDLDGDGTVGLSDMKTLLAAWGPCFSRPPGAIHRGRSSVHLNRGFSDINPLAKRWTRGARPARTPR